MASYGEETKTSPDAEHVERKCGLDMSYVKSINGILKAKQIVSRFYFNTFERTYGTMLLGSLRGRGKNT